MTDDAEKEILELVQDLDRKVTELAIAIRAQHRSMNSQFDELIQQLRTMVPEARR